MSKDTGFIAVATAGLVLAVAIGAGDWRSVRTAATARTAWEQRSAALDAALRERERRLALWTGERARLEAGFAELERAPGPPGNFGDSAMVVLAENPTVLALLLNQFRASYGLQFEVLYRRLGLAPAQIDQLEDLATAHFETAVDLRMVATSQGMEDSDPAIARLRQEDEGRFQGAARALLGGDGYRQFQDHLRKLPAWAEVNPVATRLALTSAPLTEVQAGRLLDAVAGASERYRQGGQAAGDIDWSQVLRQSRGFLSGPQLASLRTEAQTGRVDQLLKELNAKP